MRRVERLVSRILLAGGAVGVACMLVGVVALEIRATRTAHPLDIAHVVENREAGRSVDVFVSLPQLARALQRQPPDPVAVITSGVVVLLATPGIALIAAVAGFVAARDRRYAVIGAALVVALVCGFFLDLGG